jgi:hypothetical protein
MRDDPSKSTSAIIATQIPNETIILNLMRRKCLFMLVAPDCQIGRRTTRRAAS